MFALSKILLPLDFSGRSIGAAHEAKALACRFHSELHLVHVVDLRVWGMYGLGNDQAAAFEWAPGCQEWAEHEMDGFLPDEFRGVNAKRALLYGDPAREIVQYAEAQATDLIVMPTHGYGPFRRFLLGSVTAKVLHDAKCPVWTGAHLEEVISPVTVSFGRILCAIDPYNGDLNGLTWASNFSREVGAELKIVYALPTIYSPEAIDFSIEMRAQMLQEAESAIRSAQEKVGTHAEVEIVDGEPATAVYAAVKRWSADLVVISRGRASHFMGGLRSQSYSIVRESPCPVVSV